MNPRRTALLVTALLIAAFGLAPMANILTAGHALAWWGGAVREWLLYGGITALGALALAHFFGPELDAAFARLWAQVLAPRPALFAACAAGLALVLAAVMAVYAFDRQPHFQDEMAALWQARIFAAGRFAAVPSAHREFVSMMNVVDWGGWYSINPAGGPALLALGLLVGAAWLVNPICGAVAVAATYQFARRAYDESTARAAALLLAISPFFLFMAAGYQNHTPALAAFALALAALAAWRGAETTRGTVRAGIALGLVLGALVTIRPLDGALVSLTIGLFQVAHAARRRDRAPWIGLAAQAAAGAVPVALLLFANARTTGHPLTFPYDPMWGTQGLGFGPTPFGDAHTPVRALVLLSQNLMRLDVYLFEWPVPGVLLAVITLLLLRAPADWDVLTAGLITAFLGGYALYWHDGFWVGPRYIYPTIPLWVLLTVRAPRLIAGRVTHPALGRAALLFIPLCVVASLVLPSTVSGTAMRARQYHASLQQLRVDIAAQVRDARLTNALVFVHEGWGARLMARMWALGVSRPDAERLLGASDACALEMALLWEESPPPADSASRVARLRAATPEAARGTLHLRPDLTEETTLRFAEGGPLTSQCRENLVADTAGVALFPPFLAQDRVDGEGRLAGDVIFVRDLGAHNAALRRVYGDRVWYRYRVRRSGTDSGAVFAPYR